MSAHLSRTSLSKILLLHLSSLIMTLEYFCSLKSIQESKHLEGVYFEEEESEPYPVGACFQIITSSHFSPHYTKWKTRIIVSNKVNLVESNRATAPVKERDIHFLSSSLIERHISHLTP